MRTRSSLLIAGSCVISFAIFGQSGALASKTGAPEKVPYSKVAPLFKDKCVKCHNDTRASGGVNLSSYKMVMKGGAHGAIVVAKQPEKSSLIQYVDGTKKPQMPIGGAPLSADEIALLKKWITAGAKN